MSVNMGSAVAYLDLNTEKFKRGFKSAFNDLKVFQDKSAKTESKLKGLQSAFNTVGGGLTKGVTLPLLGVGAAAVKVTTDFESGMSEVQAISGATGKEFEDLRNKAKEMGAKTKFSATESAEAFKYMAMAGWKTEDMLQGIDGVMNLAAASGEDLALVSDIVTDSMTAFGLSAKDSAHFADVLAKASSNSNTNVGLMGETFKYVAPVAGALGYSVEDTATAIGLMANAGIKGSQAGTALRGMFTRLAKPTDQVAAAMKQYNISLTDAEGNMKPLSELMVDLRDRFSGLTESEKAQLAATLAGQEGMSGLLSIVNASDKDFNKLTKSINNADGASKEMADTMLNNTKGALTILKSSLEGAGIAIGERLTPYIQKLAKLITKLTEKFSGLSDNQLDFIVKIGLVAAALPVLMMLISKTIGVIMGFIKVKRVLSDVVESVKLVHAGFGELAGQMGGIPSLIAKIAGSFSTIILPVLGVIAIIGTLVAAFKHLWETNEEFRKKIEQIWLAIQVTVAAFVEDIKQRFEELGISFETVTNVIKTIWDGFCNLLAPVFIAAFQQIKNVLDVVLEMFTGFLDIIQGLFTGNWQMIWDGVQQIFYSAWKFITDTLSNFGTLISDLINVVLSWFGTSWQEIWQGIKDFFINIWNSIVAFITETIPQIIQNIINWFKTLPERIAFFMGQMVGHILNFGDRFRDWVINVLPKIIEAIVNWFKTLPSRIWQWLIQVVSNIVKWGADIKQKATEAAKGFVDNVINWFKQLPSKAKEWLDQLPKKILGIKKDMKSAGKDALSGLLDGFKDKAESILSWIGDFKDSIVSKIKNIGKSFSEGLESVRKMGRGIDGSHAGGLSYVPKNGYIAELHKGERVLTAKENEEYNKPKKPKDNGGGDTYNFYNVEPNPYEYARQIKKVKQELLEE